MSGFSAGWLALREPYDLAARNATVLDAVASAFLDQTAISVVDLACGTGSTLRAIGPHLPPRQNWRLVDNNLSLLAQVATPPGLPQLSVITRPVDLARDLELALDGPLDLVTSSSKRRRGAFRFTRRSPMTAARSRIRLRSSTPNSWPASTCTNAATRVLALRSGRARQRGPWNGSSTSGTRSCRDARIGCSGPTIGPFRKRCSPIGPGWER
jgi:hypothetical protein